MVTRWSTIICLGLALLFSMEGRAQFTVCNRTTVSMNVAVGHIEVVTQPLWYSQGWWHLTPGECKQVLPLVVGTHLAVRAEEENGPRRWPRELQGVPQYCVLQSAFERAINGGCADGDFRGFMDINVAPGVTSYTYDLVCADCQAVSAPSLPGSSPAAEAPWKQQIEWCKGNSEAGGAVNCQADYSVTYPECLISGGRQCLMGKARQSALDNDCENAFRLAMICQCHNDAAAKLIQTAGVDKVCNYLGPPTPKPVSWPPPPKQPKPIYHWPGPDFYVSMRYSCRDADGTSAGDCTITQHSGTSCAAAKQAISQTVQQNGDVCRHCPGSTVTDNSRSQYGGAVDVTGGGQCVTP
jgi:uncharacterized membrane protein